LFLDKPPLPVKINYSDKLFKNEVQHLPPLYIKIDATYFGRNRCLIVIKDQYGNFIYWSFVSRENFFNYKQDLINISKWYNIKGITSDWNGSLVSAVKHILPKIPHQRCLVHLQRRCQSLLTRKPKSRAGKELLKLVKSINQLDTKQKANKWLYRVYAWHEKYENYIKQRTYHIKEDGTKTWWYKHKNTRASYRTIIKDTDHLFLYLNNKNLDKDTNGLEVEFSYLKHKLRTHRGLKTKRKVAMMYWYLHFKNLEKRRN